MGSGVSTDIPDYLDIHDFAELSGDRFDRDFFYAYKDPSTGTLSKQKFLEFANLTDLYFSYCWGPDEDGERLQDRLGIITTWLSEKGLICHYDGDLQSYQCGHESIREEIDNSQIFIACVTQKYINKVKRIEGAKPNKNSFEFNHAKHTKTFKNMVFLIMDRSVLHLSSWSDLIGKKNTEIINIHDFTVNTDHNYISEVLYKNIISLVTPLRLFSFQPQATATIEKNHMKILQIKSKLIKNSSVLYSDTFALSAAAEAIADVFNESPCLPCLPGVSERGVLERSVDDKIVDNVRYDGINENIVNNVRYNGNCNGIYNGITDSDDNDNDNTRIYQSAEYSNQYNSEYYNPDITDPVCQIGSRSRCHSPLSTTSYDNSNSNSPTTSRKLKNSPSTKKINKINNIILPSNNSNKFISVNKFQDTNKFQDENKFHDENRRLQVMTMSILQNKKILENKNKNLLNGRNTDSASSFFTRKPYYLSDTKFLKFPTLESRGISGESSILKKKSIQERRKSQSTSSLVSYDKNKNYSIKSVRTLSVDTTQYLHDSTVSDIFDK